MSPAQRGGVDPGTTRDTSPRRRSARAGDPEALHADGETLDIVVVGGGITSLALAHRLALSSITGRPWSVRMFEKNTRWGGLVHSVRHGDWLFEGGPDSMVTAKPAALELCRELGLEGEIVAPVSGATFSLVKKGRLHPLPEGFRMIAPTRPGPLMRSRLLSFPGKLRLLSERFVPRGGDVSDDFDESAESFVVRRFGREAYERIASPVLGGLFVGDAAKLSAKRTLGPFLVLEQKYGSVSRGLRATRAGAGSDSSPPQLSLEGGIGALTRALLERIPAGWLRSGCEATCVIHTGEEKAPWRIDTRQGSVHSRHVVLACPAPRARDLLRTSVPDVAEALGRLPFASCATVSLVYRASDLASPLDFGFFVPRGESFDVLAATYSSRKFPSRAPEGDFVIRTFHGGALDETALERSDEQLVADAHAAISALLAARAEPIHQRVFRAPESMPQFEVGHLRRSQELSSRLAATPGLHLGGSAFGLYGLADCVVSAEMLARALTSSRAEATAT